MVRKGFTVLLIGSVIGAAFGFVGLLYFADFLSPGLSAFVSYLLMDKPAVTNTNDSQLLQGFIDRGVVSNPQELLDSVVTFYTVVIEILIALIGVIAALTFIYIKTATEDRAKEHVAGEVQRKFDEASFQDGVKSVVREANRPYFDEVKQKIVDLDNLDVSASDLSDAYLKIQDLDESNNELREELEERKIECMELSDQLKFVVERLAVLDTSESIDEETIDLPEDDNNGHS